MTDADKAAIEKLKGIPGILGKLKSMFSKIEEDSAEVKLSEVKLKDGTILSIEGEAPAVGAAVQVVAEGGNVPAPDGEYELEDGSKITIASGKISEMKPADKPADKPVEMGADVLKSLTDRLDALEAKAKTGEEKLAEANKVIEKQKTELKAQLEIQKETFALVETLAAMPATKPIEAEKKIDTKKEDRLIELSKTIKGLKN